MNRFFVIALGMMLAGNLFSSPLQKTNIGGLSPDSARSKLMAAAESYLGTPYRYSGTDSRGLDCSGLVFASFRDGLTISVPRTSSGLYAWTERISISELEAGDLVFFITTGPGISHVGIYAGNNRFIHAPSEGSKTGVTYSALDEPYWKRTFAGAGRALPPGEAPSSAAGGSPALAPDAPGSNQETGESRYHESTGLIAGIGFMSGFGGFVDGSAFRGLGLQVKIGYKGFLNPAFQAALEIRPQWDRFLGIYRFSFTLAFGNDTFQVFAGPSITVGEPRIRLNSRSYTPGFGWLGEAGFSAAFRPILISGGGLSIFGEIAWLPYSGNDGFNLLSDLAANTRLSLGLRYVWLPNGL